MFNTPIYDTFDTPCYTCGQLAGADALSVSVLRNELDAICAECCAELRRRKLQPRRLYRAAVCFNGGAENELTTCEWRMLEDVFGIDPGNVLPVAIGGQYGVPAVWCQKTQTPRNQLKRACDDLLNRLTDNGAEVLGQPIFWTMPNSQMQEAKIMAVPSGETRPAVFTLRLEQPYAGWANYGEADRGCFARKQYLE